MRLSFLLFLVLGTAYAAPKGAQENFTAWSETSKEAWFGVLKTEKGYEPEARLGHYVFEAKAARSVSVPSELQGREVIALFPIKEGVLVVTQLRVEQGDEPRVNTYSLKTKKWNDLGKVACPTPEKISVEKSTLKTICDKEGVATTLKLELPKVSFDNTAKSERVVGKKSELNLGSSAQSVKVVPKMF